MKLSNRLKSIASLIDKDTTVIDIGCDHALLDIYLTINGTKCIAADINKNALEIAQYNIKKYNLSDKIKTVLSDGLKNIEIPTNNTIVICGMGTKTIIDILKDTSKLDNLIVQSNNELEELRRYITSKNFYIDKEIKLKDKNKFYTLIKFKKGIKKYSKFEYIYGIDYSNKEYIDYEINKNNFVLNKMPKKYFIKRYKLKQLNKYLKNKL